MTDVGCGNSLAIADDDMWVRRVRGEDVREVTLTTGHVSGGAGVHEPLSRGWWCQRHGVESLHEGALVEGRGGAVNVGAGGGAINDGPGATGGHGRGGVGAPGGHGMGEATP